MKPVRIKYYGLFWMTRRTYLLLTLGAALFASLMMLAFVFGAGDRVPPFSWPWEPVPAALPPGFQGLFYHHFWTFIILLLFAESLDILVTLRKFREKEIEELEDHP